VILVETEEELKRQFTEWTVKYVKANEYFNSLLPSADLSQPFLITPELLDEFTRAQKEVETALTKQREIIEKLSQLRRIKR
jgi:hypothetical protein